VAATQGLRVQVRGVAAVARVARMVTEMTATPVAMEVRGMQGLAAPGVVCRVEMALQASNSKEHMALAAAVVVALARVRTGEMVVSMERVAVVPKIIAAATGGTARKA
jgi:hypothetical protein